MRNKSKCGSDQEYLLFRGGCGFFSRTLLRCALYRRDSRFNYSLTSSGSPPPESSAMNLTAPRTLITFSHWHAPLSVFLCALAPLRASFHPKTPGSKSHFFINSSTAVVIALIPVRKVGSGCGSNKLECNEGRGFPDFAAAATLAGSTAPNQNMKAGI